MEKEIAKFQIERKVSQLIIIWKMVLTLYIE